MRRSHHTRTAAAAISLLIAGAAACGILDVQQPNIVDPTDLDTPTGAEAKRLGAINIFGLAKDGDFNPVAIPGSEDTFNDFSDGHILLSGILADEFVNPGFIPSRTEVDVRRAQPVTAGLGAFFQSLHRARSAAEDAAVSLQAFSDDPDANTGIPEMLALAGFTYIFLAEDFCSGIPVSRVEGEQIVFGEPLTTAQVFDTAIARFNAALAHPSIAPGDEIHSLASVGLARALLNQGEHAEAALAVASVPSDFIYETEHANTPANLHNGVFEAFNNGEFGVFDQEGGVGLNFVSAEDLRVTGDSGLGADFSTESWFPSKYPGFDSSIPTADYLEAQLIIAESELHSDIAAMTLRLNALREPVGLEPLAQPGDLTAATDLLFRERAFWLYATGHRLGDLRRLIRQYDRAADTVFPSGAYFRGGLTYGTAVNLPLPRREGNNPNTPDAACLDRNA